MSDIGQGIGAFIVVMVFIIIGGTVAVWELGKWLFSLIF